MYAIAFDLDTETLRSVYSSDSSTSWNNAYAEIRAALETHGFEWRQGSVYFGNAEVTPVTCVLAVQELKRTYRWFERCVRDIRMLRIEENNDLLPALG
jgi:virulence-associated protein VapD